MSRSVIGDFSHSDVRRFKRRMRENQGETFIQRKLTRTEYYFRFVFGWKLRKCSACNGSGYYDSMGNPTCQACNGTGKERFKSVTE